MRYEDTDILPDGTLLVRRFVVDRSDEEIAALERQYAPKLIEAAPKSAWLDLGDGVAEMSIPSRPGARMIHGLASSSSLNSHGYSLISHGMDAELPAPLLSSHKGHQSPIGEVVFIRRTQDRIYVRAQLHDNEASDYAWKLIEAGELRCFSGAAADGTLKLQGIVNDKTFYGEWKLGEVSIAPEGANPDSHFEIYEPGADETKFFCRPIADRSANGIITKHSDPALPYAGTWKADQWFEPGQFVTHRGALWLARIKSHAVRPNEAPGIWKLVVKSGEANKLETKDVVTPTTTTPVKDEAQRRRKERTTVTAYDKNGRIKEFVKEEIIEE